MRIVDAIMQVLKECDKPLTHVQIYNLIKKDNVYIFGARDPQSVVRSKLRKHCYGLDFPSASPVKYFKIAQNTSEKAKPSYSLHVSEDSPTKQSVSEKTNSNEQLVEEIIHNSYNKHIFNLKAQLLSMIKSEDPAFFEQLVVNLLLKMGYGWNKTTSGKIIGGAGDEGIDGIVSEDKLCLETIYIQAKRYSNQSVPPREVRDFIGAMALKGARKGVFFTTSKFTKQANQHAADMQGMRITLVDGELLADLLVQHEMAIAPIKSYTVYEVDKNFFSVD
jgi:restriction system protein